MIFQDWHKARAKARECADFYGRAYGIEKTKHFGADAFSVFMLSAPAFRFGRELACEVVEPSIPHAGA